MYFYLYNIENYKGNVLLSGREYLAPKDVDLNKLNTYKSRIRQFNININPPAMPYLLVCGYNVKTDEDINKAIESVTRHLDENNEKGVSIDVLKQKNYVDKTLGENLILLRLTNLRRPESTRFESPYFIKALPQFKCNREYFIISKKIKGPCLVEIDFETDDIVYNQFKKVNLPSIDCLTILNHIDLPNLNHCSLALKYKHNVISAYSLCINGKKIVSGCLSSNGVLKTTKVGCNLFITYGNVKTMVKDIQSKLDSEEIDNLTYYNLPQSVLSQFKLERFLICDLFSYASGTLKSRDYSLDSLSDYFNYVKGDFKYAFEHGDIFSELSNEAKTIYELYMRSDALLLCKEIAEISGLSINSALANKRAEMIDFTLLHEFYERNLLLPGTYKQESQKYMGGLVLNPLVGVYDTATLLLDFNSLYPSIIEEYNVCFSTIGQQNTNTVSLGTEINDETMLKIVNDAKSKPKGILPRILSNLVSRRKQVKRLMAQSKDDDIKMYDIRQKALKLLANSIYGCLGFTSSRFCNYLMAAFITRKGRELLVEAQNIVTDKGYRVIYGDTDSIMINTELQYSKENIDKIKLIGDEVKAVINSRYQHIEIELEKIFVKLFLYTKKKYAGVWVKDDDSFKNEYKGIDSIRRDCPQAAVDILDAVLNTLLDHDKLNDAARTRDEIITLLYKESSRIRERPHTDFIISTILSKSLGFYPSNTYHPHVDLANRLVSRGMSFQQGDVISYIICKSDNNQPVYKRALLPDEITEIDYDYYISQKILPPLSRILQITNFISNEELQRIFGCQKSVLRNKIVPTYQRKFTTPCCNHIQGPLKVCEKCNVEITEEFYFKNVKEIINKEIVSLYSTEPVCPECSITLGRLKQRCDNCNVDVVYSPQNEEFNMLIENLGYCFKETGFLNVQRFINFHIEHSGYNIIDLRNFFAEEISNYNLIKNLQGYSSSFLSHLNQSLLLSI